MIDQAIQEIFAANAAALVRYRGGEEKLFGFFMGQVMRATKGKADPARGEAAAGGVDQRVGNESTSLS